jgi:hypothetical protein
MPYPEAFFGALAVDAALDLKQRIDTPDCLQRDRRDRRGVVPAPCIGRDVSEFEELPSRMSPTQRRCDRSRQAGQLKELIVAIISIGLQNAGKVSQMPEGMLAPPVARGMIQRCRRRPAAEGPVVADISPDVPLDRLAFRQDRDRGVVTMQPLGGQDMSLYQRMKRLQGQRTGADLVGHRRQAQINALPPIPLALAVQWLMLTELLEQDHGQQIRPGKAARGHMEGRGGLGNRLALPARELLADRLHHLPAPWNNLQRLGDIFAQLRQLR